MKRKGITIWEQQIERIVLGVALLFFIAIVGWQIVRDPHTVTESGQRISPGEIDELVQAKARDINSRLDASAPSPIDIPDYEPVLSEFAMQLRAPVSHVDRIAMLQREIRLMSIDMAPTELVMYHVPVPPAPEVLSSRQFYDALQEDVLDHFPELETGFRAPTHDGTWVVPAAVIDLDAVRRSFEASTDDSASIPPNFYENRIDILHLTVERMRQGEDGSWSDLTVLDVPPGMLTLEPQLRGEVSKGLRDEVLGELRRAGGQLEIVRPSFYPTRAGAFVPPTEMEDLADARTLTDADREIRRIRSRIRDLTARRRQIEEQIRNLGGDPSRPAGPTPPGGGDGPAPPGGSGRRDPGDGAAPGGPGGGFGDPGGSGRRDPGGRGQAPGGGGLGDPGGGAGSPAGPAGPNPQARIAALQAELARLITRIDRERARLEGLTGRDPDGIDEGVEAVPLDPTSAERLVVWAHDITAVPGETYRYRFTVQYYNPFFARRLDLLPEQHHLADAMMMASSASGWSRPLEVKPPQRVFMVEANPAAGEAGFGEATFEVYRFHDARWWRDAFRVEPGLHIGGLRRVRGAGSRQADTEIDFTTDWYLLDVVQDLDADRDSVERGRGAVAIVQRVSTPARMVMDPRLMIVDPFREWLRWSIEEAERDPAIALRDP